MFDFLPCSIPGKEPLLGEYVRVEPIKWDASFTEFVETILGAENASLWDFMSIGPYETVRAFEHDFKNTAKTGGWEVMSLTDIERRKVQGIASFMRIRPQHGSAEIGFILFNQKLQKTRAATEAIFLLIAHLFDDLNYRRVEWKCDNNNLASKNAALRLGFQYEGLFRQDLIVKGKNRDTAWFSILDKDWPSVKSRFEIWLLSCNFDEQGRQIKALNPQD